MEGLEQGNMSQNRITDPVPISSPPDAMYGDCKPDPLEGYEQYGQPNWDGFGANPITGETIRCARKLLSIMPKTFGEPDIAPSADGLIGLEWVRESGPLDRLFLDIGPSEEWVAYWTRRSGEFGRLPGRSATLGTKRTLEKLFDELSK